MSRIEKTVFISYRRGSGSAWALAISQNLTHQGYDVFFDYQGIASGDFAQVILENIKARAHFLVLLTPSALERIDEPGDWLRREIESALESRRNIVPLMLEGFDFATPSIGSHLTGTLAPLKAYSGLTVPIEFFDEAMNRLRTRHLNVPVDAVLHPSSRVAKQAAVEQSVAVEGVPTTSHDELTAEWWVERGFAATDVQTKLLCFTTAIRLKPDYADAFFNRGVVLHERADLDGALADYTEAIRLKPDHVGAYFNRAQIMAWRNDHLAAIDDYQKYLDFGGGMRKGDQAEVEEKIRELRKKL
jgi:hypothetical protein